MEIKQVGILSAVMLFVGFFAQPAGGMIYDRVGGRKLYAVSALVASIGLLLFTNTWGYRRCYPRC
jgi:nitrate/nitrite transporter NarK